MTKKNIELEMSDRSILEFPWNVLPGVKRPRFEFPTIKFSIPSRVPNSLLYSLIFFTILYVYIGGVYDLVEDPLAFGATQGGDPALIFRGQDRQFLLEGMVAGLLMFLGAVGLYLFSQATADPHDTSRATVYQGIGAILIIFSFFMLQVMFSCKTGKSSC